MSKKPSQEKQSFTKWSYFGAALTRLLDAREMTGRELARKSGLIESKISRLKIGEQRYLSRHDLLMITKCFSEWPEEQAKLVAAHLMDECSGPGSELVRITIHDGPKKMLMAKISSRVNEAIETILGQVVKDPAKEKFVIELASMFGKGKES